MNIDIPFLSNNFCPLLPIALLFSNSFSKLGILQNKMVLYVKEDN